MSSVFFIFFKIFEIFLKHSTKNTMNARFIASLYNYVARGEETKRFIVKSSDVIRIAQKNLLFLTDSQWQPLQVEQCPVQEEGFFPVEEYTAPE